MPLDDQGGTWVCISNKPQLINQGSTKIKKMAWQKNKKGVQHKRQDAHEQLKQGNLQAGREDHHKPSTLHYMVSSRSNNEGKILR